MSIRSYKSIINCYNFKIFPLDLTCINLNIPETSETDGNLDLAFSYSGKTFRQIKPVKIKETELKTFIETDKSVYKPNENVRFRILTIDHNLIPINKEIHKVWIENPTGSRLYQWRNVTVNTGFVQLDIKLSSEPALVRIRVLIC